jgi:uncharacterized protein Gcw-chp
MKKLVLSTTTALVLSTALAAAADMPVKAPPAPVAVPTNPFDIAFGAAVMTDYNFRGISQTNRQPGITAYFEPRYNINDNWQLYAGVGGYSIEFPNNAAAEIDIYGGVRPTFGKFAFDFGVWYYYYPGGRTFPGITPAPFDTAFAPNPFCTNQFTTPTIFCNAIKSDVSFIEFYGKLTYSWTDNFATGTAVYYDPDWLNTGASGWYLSSNAKYTGTAFPNGFNWYISGEFARYYLGTTDAFYVNTPLPDYNTWNVGIGLTYKVFTLDFRYYDTDLSKAECNVLTGDHTASFSPGNITGINPSGLGSKWCNAAFVVALKADLTLNSNVK